MNNKRLITIASLLIIVVGGIILLLRHGQDNKELAKEVPTESRGMTEEDYKATPKYVLEETIVSNGKHLELPEIEHVWNFDWYETQIPRGAIEISEQGYNSIINQFDNDLNIPRFEESEYKDRVVVGHYIFYVCEYVWDDESPPEIEYLDPEDEEAKVMYVMRVPAHKYQTKWHDEIMAIIVMYEKYGKYYMGFNYCRDYYTFSYSSNSSNNR